MVLETIFSKSLKIKKSTTCESEMIKVVDFFCFKVFLRETDILFSVQFSVSQSDTKNSYAQLYQEKVAYDLIADSDFRVLCVIDWFCG